MRTLPKSRNDPSTPVEDGAVCELCLRDAGDCECPECPVCKTAGDPSCASKHGLSINLTRLYARENALFDQVQELNNQRAAIQRTYQRIAGVKRNEVCELKGGERFFVHDISRAHFGDPFSKPGQKEMLNISLRGAPMKADGTPNKTLKYERRSFFVPTAYVLRN